MRRTKFYQIPRKRQLTINSDMRPLPKAECPVEPGLAVLVRAELIVKGLSLILITPPVVKMANLILTSADFPILLKFLNNFLAAPRHFDGGRGGQFTP